MEIVTRGVTVSKNNKGFAIAVGKQGGGKTVFAVKNIVDELKTNPSRPVFSNIDLYGGIPYIKIRIKVTKDYIKQRWEEDKVKVLITPSEIEKHSNNKNTEVMLSILDTLKEDEKYFNESIILLDEIHVELNSFDYLTDTNRQMQSFFSQLRKRNIFLFATTQHLKNVDVRIRRQLLFMFMCKQFAKNSFRIETYQVEYDSFSHRTTYEFDLKDYYQLYNTNELIV